MPTDPFSSVRSTSSTATSGFLEVSHSIAVNSRTPPPDYDTDSDSEVSRPTTHRQGQCSRYDGDRGHVRREEIQPLNIHHQETGFLGTRETMIQMDHVDRNVHVGLVDNTSPLSTTNGSVHSPGSTAGDATFLYGSRKERRRPRHENNGTCCRLQTKKEECLCTALTIVTFIAVFASTVVILFAADVI